MADTFQCPACGGLIEYSVANQAMSCPFCGTAITTPELPSAPASAADLGDPSASAKTLVQASKFKNSAEILDEVKRLVREGDKNGAIKVYSKEFGVPRADAKTSVDQIEIDMLPPPPPPVEESAPPPPPPAPLPHSPIPDPAVISGEVVDATPPSSGPNKWLIGCSIAFVLFCCLCVILPSIVWVVLKQMGNL